jgi:hypothetical protein
MAASSSGRSRNICELQSPQVVTAFHNATLELARSAITIHTHLYGYGAEPVGLAGETAGGGASGQLGLSQVGQQSLQQGMNRPPTLKDSRRLRVQHDGYARLVLAGPYKRLSRNRVMKFKL